MREGDAFEELVRINCSFGSSGLNIACEGLLLRMRKGVRKETPMKLHLMRRTFIGITIADTSACFAGRDDLAQRRCALDPHQHLDRLHLHHSFCRKGAVQLKGEAQV
jgi:hypothetical protein